MRQLKLVLGNSYQPAVIDDVVCCSSPLVRGYRLIRNFASIFLNPLHYIIQSFILHLHSSYSILNIPRPYFQKYNTLIKMEKAKAAVGNFLSKDGKHDTTVHEVISHTSCLHHISNYAPRRSTLQFSTRKSPPLDKRM